MTSENHEDELDIRPGMEPLTPEELERFLARARAQGRLLTSEEQYALFGPPQETSEPAPLYADVEQMEEAELNGNQLDELQTNFFPELGEVHQLPIQRLVQGVIFDFDNTLAYLSRPLGELMEEGAKAAEAYMHSMGMEFPENFWENIIEARRFALEKSEEEQEEHIADDAMSFLLQFFGYPASQMDPTVLKQAVDIFYAPEMAMWKAILGAVETVQALHKAGYKIAILANYNCDRVFQRMVDYAGFRPYIDASIASASIEYRKPDVKAFELILERWDALPYEVVVVGDSLRHDIQGGLETGALTVQVLLDTPHHDGLQVVHDNVQAAEQIQADAVIQELSQLPALIQQWASA